MSHESFVLIPHDLALLTCKGSPLEALQRQQAYLSSLGIDLGIWPKLLPLTEHRMHWHDEVTIVDQPRS